jgi:alkaline phosphatase
MKRQFLSLILFVFVLNIFAQTPKNVILLIGDGMGTAHFFTLISTIENNSIEQFPIVGFQKTASASNFITESAAAATALSTGKKTNNTYVSLDPETKKPMKTLIQLSNAKGLSSGVIASSDIAHSTPGAFLSHATHRHNYEDVAAGILSVNPTLMIGGGRNRFENRTDNRNLSDSLKKLGFQVLYTLDDVLKTQNPKVAGLLYDVHPESMAKGRGEFLKPASQKAIELLNQNLKGFFLMIESSQIDWLCHENNFDDLLDELRDFDNTIHAVLEFAKKDGNTLVIVTGDHETGGLIVIEKDGKPFGKFASMEHTATMIPVFAFGPGAELFSGIYENNEIQKKIVKLLGL